MSATSRSAVTFLLVLLIAVAAGAGVFSLLTSERLSTLVTEFFSGRNAGQANATRSASGAADPQQGQPSAAGNEASAPATLPAFNASIRDAAANIAGQASFSEQNSSLKGVASPIPPLADIQDNATGASVPGVSGAMASSPSGGEPLGGAFGAERPDTPQGKNATASEIMAPPAGQQAEAFTPESGRPEAAVIISGKGRPVPGGVRGRAPAGKPVDTTGLYGSPEDRMAVEQGDPLPAGRNGRAPFGEDTVVSAAFPEDLASFLVTNYWPAGTHPAARLRGVLTADLKWANIHFGSRLQGFSVSRDDPQSARNRILRYALTPSMLNGLYTLYGQRFLSFMDRFAEERRIGPEGKQRPLSPAEIAEMYALYASRAQSLAGTIRAYCNAPEVRALLNRLHAAEDHAYEAYSRLIAAMDAAGNGTAPPAELQQAYQRAVTLREQARVNVAATMRRSGNTRTMDAESLVYAAAWMQRRGSGGIPGLKTLAGILDRIAARFEEAELRWRALPTPSPSSR